MSELHVGDFVQSDSTLPSDERSELYGVSQSGSRLIVGAAAGTTQEEFENRSRELLLNSLRTSLWIYAGEGRTQGQRGKYVPYLTSGDRFLTPVVEYVNQIPTLLKYHAHAASFAHQLDSTLR